MTSPIEILVHISGPSRIADDGRYRREALGLLDFKPVKTHAVYGERTLEEHIPIPPPNHHTAPSASGDTLSANGPHSLAKTTPSHPQRGATPAPFPPQSRTPHILIAATPALPRPRTAPTNPTPSQEPRPLRRTQSDSWQTPPSVIPDSQPTPPVPSLGAQAHSSPYRKRVWESSSPSPIHKRPRTNIESSSPATNNAEPSHNSATKPPPPAVPPSSTNPPPPPPLPPLHHPLPQTIHPPTPPPSILPLTTITTHLTPSLLTLSTQLHLSKHFHPLTRSRALEKLERGHWRIPLGTWERGLRERFWGFMRRFVGEGRGGWGVWCVWEGGGGRRGGGEGGLAAGLEDGLADGDAASAAMAGAADRHGGRLEGGEVVKVFCWGEIVGEIWILLFVASGRRVKGVGARWVDAGGEAVVVMR